MSNTRMLALTFFAHLVFDGFELVLPTLLPVVAQEFSLSYSQIGVLAGCLAISLGAGQFLMGYLSDKTGKRKIFIVLGLLCLSASFYFIGVSQSYGSLVIWNLLAGLGGSVYHPVSVSLISQVYRERKGRALGIHGAGGNLGMAAFPLVSGVLADMYGWRFVFKVFPVMGFVVCLLFFLLVKEESIVKKPVELKNLFYLKIATVVIALGFVSMASRGLHIFLPLKLSDLGYSSADFGLFLSLFNGFGVLGQVLGGYYSDIYEKTKMISILSVVSGVFMYALLHANNYTVMLGFVALAGLIFNSIWPTLFGLLTDRTPEQLHGTGLGLFFSAGYIMGSSAPVLMGVVTDLVSMQISFILVPVFAGIGALVILKKQ
ncbi:MAG: MFS transporter [Theionarchaea archaeon]|nr:MFS transporter [Theionarchaea archaeon]